MNKLMTSLMCSGMLFAGAQAFAADPPAQTPATGDKPMMTMTPEMKAKHDAAMKDCMDKQKAANATMSTDDMTKACKSEMKMKHDATAKKPY
jgi:hypothetical protein